jgi:hypothetical protein
MNKKLAISLVIISLVALGFSVFNFTRPSQAPVQSPETTELGAIPGNTVQGSEFTVNGVKHVYKRAQLGTGTTTPGALMGPNSTSTLIFGSFSGTASSTGEVILSMSQAANAFATTTRIGDEFLTTSGSKHTIIASTTDSGGSALEGTHIFAPNAWLVFGIEGTTVGGNNAASGYVEAEWIVN